ncbi:cupin domain-containing protein [Microbacterium sp. W4I20]|uniref:helix-turn-helix domain-containing protein n=1 Tax=Microbacterium sp. W4I20 TaxID=3042262 RepID=UPI00277ED9CE|nr:cupin domain-containing protein [Microbacterium sp. W4I20]MDQ0727657.1 transcriptional regulator with XRE-family HTH domain [Microbacterium sp. W4I20]
MDDDRKALGARIRAVRRNHRISIRGLAETADLSPASISQIENGKANASFDALRRIASALGLTFAELFDAAQPATGRVLRRAERPLLPTEEGVRSYGITRPPVGEVDVAVSEYQPGAFSGGHDYTHGNSREVVIILRGRFSFELDGEEFLMEPGDSLDFRTNVSHMITNVGEEVGEALWVVSPPSTPRQ